MQINKTIPINATLRGYITSISEENELTRGNGQFKTGYHFLRLDAYEMNGQRIDKGDKVVVKIYVTDQMLGRRDIKHSIIFYATNDLSKPDLEFQTGIVNVEKLHKAHVGVRGMIKAEDRDPYTHFMNKVEKIKIFPTSKTYLKKSAKKTN